MEKLFFLTCLLAGLLLTWLAFKLFLEIKSKKELLYSKLNGNNYKVEFKTSGLFSIALIGTGFIEPAKSFEVIILDENNDDKNVEILKSYAKYRFKKDGKKGIEVLKFRINKPGFYNLKIKSANDLLVMKKSMLKTKRFFQSEIENNKEIEILVKEALTFKRRILFFIFIVFGINLTLWGIVGVTFW